MEGAARRGFPLDQTLDRPCLHASSTCHRALWRMQRRHCERRCPAVSPGVMSAYLRPRRRTPFCWRWRLWEGLWKGVVIGAPSVERWGGADRTLLHKAGPLELYGWLWYMVALFVSKLSIFASSVLLCEKKRCNCMTTLFLSIHLILTVTIVHKHNTRSWKTRSTEHTNQNERNCG